MEVRIFETHDKSCQYELEWYAGSFRGVANSAVAVVNGGEYKVINFEDVKVSLKKKIGTAGGAKYLYGSELCLIRMAIVGSSAYVGALVFSHGSMVVVACGGDGGDIR